MRYPLIFIILALLLLAMPLHKQNAAHTNRPSLVHMVLSDSQQHNGKQLLDHTVHKLRTLPPLHQVLAMATVTILLVNAAVVLSYLVNSVASIAGIGVSLAWLIPLLLLAVFLRSHRRTLYQRMKKHAEFGPFVSRVSTRMWKKRFRRAAREHGWTHEY